MANGCLLNYSITKAGMDAGKDFYNYKVFVILYTMLSMIGCAILL